MLNSAAPYRKLASAIIVTIGLSVGSGASLAQISGCEPLNEIRAADSLAEHLFGGNPGDLDPHVRRGYALEFDGDRQVPRWVAWRAAPEYRNPPPRQGRWSSFRADPVSSVRDRDYVGWYDSEHNFARGHIAPYFIAGGDRNNDGSYAAVGRTTEIDDVFDACTVYEINAFGNITPQYHDLFNGPPGLWYLLETDIRHLIDNGRSFNIIAGTIFIEDQILFIGDRDTEEESWSIAVPHGFFKIVIDEAALLSVGFLFDHESDVPGGCNLEQSRWPSDCIVPIEAIEAVTGLSFFADLPDEDSRLLRTASTRDTWMRWVRALR